MERELRTREEETDRNRTEIDKEKNRNVKTGGMKDYLHILAGSFGHLGWEDEKRDGVR